MNARPRNFTFFFVFFLLFSSRSCRVNNGSFHEQALYDLIEEFEWKKFTILYESSDSLVRTNELLKKSNPNGFPVTIRHLGNGPFYRCSKKKRKIDK